MNPDEDIYNLEEPDAGTERRDQHAHAPAATTRYAVRCNRCGYDLVGLTVGSYCPECGHQVGLGGNMDAPTSGYAITSLVMGILSIVSCSFYGIPALVFGPLAIWFAAKARAQVMQGAASTSSLGLATAGKVTGIIGLCIAGAIVILFFVLMVLVGYGMGSFP